jgi:PAS domain S-box-containing protein
LHAHSEITRQLKEARKPEGNMELNQNRSSAVGGITIDDSGIIKSFDATAETIFGYIADEVVGHNVTCLMPEPYHSEHDGYLARYLHKGDPHVIGKGREVVGQRKDGTTFPLWLAVNEVRLGGEHIFVGSILDLSRNKAVESDLARSLEVTRAILDTAVNPIITINPDGAIRSFNPAAEQLFGYESDEVINHNVKKLMPEPYHSEHDGYLHRYLEGGAPHVIGTGREVVGQRKDGTTFPMHLSVGAMELADGRMFVGIITDITEQKAAEEELRQHRDHLEDLVAMATAEVKAIVQTAVSGIVTIDESGIIHLFNPSAEELFGWKSKELVGKNVSFLMEEPHAAQHDGYLNRYLETGEARIIGIGREVVAKRKDGSTFPANLAVGHTRLSDKHRLFVAFISDISAQKRNEAALKQAKEEAEAGAQAKAAFLANMSHEIRTPMNSIMGFAEVVLQAPELTPETVGHVRTILNSSKSLLGLINDILDVSKLESGKFTLETVCFHLPNALAEALRTVEQRATEKGLAVKIKYDPALPMHFVGDPSRLRQVILNLMGNAIKFTKQGEVTIQVLSGQEDELLHFMVTDTGIGMTQGQVEKVFESFSQADSSTTRRFGGTGLGTTISKQIVELMGGEIWVESEPDKGSAFHFTAHMPEAINTEGCLYEEVATIIDEYVSPRLFRVLLAEDIVENATLATLRLEQQGHEIYWAKNGLEVVEAFRNGQYDLILMDVMMPKLDGLDATRKIRELEQETKAHIPILALTASVMQEDHARCLASGMDSIEAKPIDFNNLFAAIEQHVPEGKGKPNSSRIIEIDHSAELDLSPLQGVADIAKALQTWRNPRAYAKALVSFAKEQADDAVEIERLLTKIPGDMEPARVIAHALKGVAGNLVLEQVAQLAIDIDAALKSDQQQALQMTGALNHALVAAVTAIGNLALPDTEITPLKIFDAIAAGDLMVELLSVLDELNPDAAEPALTRLAEYISESDLAPIRQEMEAFDFDAAKSKALILAGKMDLNLGEKQ